jgi:hypothetical protein
MPANLKHTAANMLSILAPDSIFYLSAMGDELEPVDLSPDQVAKSAGYPEDVQS